MHTREGVLVRSFYYYYLCFFLTLLAAMSHNSEDNEAGHVNDPRLLREAQQGEFARFTNGGYEGNISTHEYKVGGC